jgi:hypothetical protein
MSRTRARMSGIRVWGFAELNPLCLFAAFKAASFCTRLRGWAGFVASKRLETVLRCTPRKQSCRKADHAD